MRGATPSMTGASDFRNASKLSTMGGRMLYSSRYWASVSRRPADSASSNVRMPEVAAKFFSKCSGSAARRSTAREGSGDAVTPDPGVTASALPGAGCMRCASRSANCARSKPRAATNISSAVRYSVDGGSSGRVLSPRSRR
jgi:hypothetical protein